MITEHAVENTAAGREAWLKRRERNVNASEIGALVGQHPYLTAFELYCAKTGRAALDPPDEGILWRGQIFEPAAAEAVASRRPAWTVTKADVYLEDKALRLGATPDYFIDCPKRGRGVLQLKTVGTLPTQTAHWSIDDLQAWESDATPPLWIQLQTLTEQMLADVQWGAIGALLLDPNKPRIVIREFERHAAAEARLVRVVRQFWADAAKGIAPIVDYARDDEIIKALYPRDDGSTVDLSGDNRLPGLLERRQQASDEARALKKEIDAINTEIAAKMGEATYAVVPGWKLTRKLQKRAPIAASEFRVLRVSRRSRKEQEKAA